MNEIKNADYVLVSESNKKDLEYKIGWFDKNRDGNIEKIVVYRPIFLGGYFTIDNLYDKRLETYKQKFKDLKYYH